MDATQRVKNNFLESIQVKTESLDKLAPIIAAAADRIANSLLNNRKILACGNGGSAADAQHFRQKCLIVLKWSGLAYQLSHLLQILQH